MQLLHSHALGWGKKIKGGRIVRRNTVGCKPALCFSHSHLCCSLEQPWALPQQVLVSQQVVSQQGRRGRAHFVLMQGFAAKPQPPLPSHLCWRMAAGTRCSWWQGKDPGFGSEAPAEDRLGFLTKKQSLPCASQSRRGSCSSQLRSPELSPACHLHLFLAGGISNISQYFSFPAPLRSICWSHMASGPSWIKH